MNIKVGNVYKCGDEEVVIIAKINERQFWKDFEIDISGDLFLASPLDGDGGTLYRITDSACVLIFDEDGIFRGSGEGDNLTEIKGD